MISGNVPINSQPIIQSAGNGTNLFNAVFASRLVKQQVSDGNAPGPLSDPAREKLLKELEDDGGKASFKRLLARLAYLRPAQAQYRIGPVISSPWSYSGWDVSSKEASDRQRRQAPRHNKPQPISNPPSIHQELGPGDLSLNGQFVRLGGGYEGLLVERGNDKGDVIYRFRSKHSKVPDGPALNGNVSVELSNCFYPIGDNLAGSPWQNNTELAKMTGAYLNACDGLGKQYYSGEFDININMRSAGNVTVFRLMPHGDGLQYIDSSNTIQKLSIEGTSVDEYMALKNSGAQFEGNGAAPLTMGVENRDGKYFFTVKTRSDYSPFKRDDNHCDILPPKSTGIPPSVAKCCTDGVNQQQDVKYLYSEPLKWGWFHVWFNVAFSDYSRANDTGSPFAAFGIDDFEGVMSYGRIGNNNRDSALEPSGYHAQFGIAEAGKSSVFLRVKNPKFNHARRQNPPQSDWILPQKLSGECHYMPESPSIRASSSPTEPITAKSDMVPTSRPHTEPPDPLTLLANNLTSQVSKSELRQRLEGILTFGPRDNDYNSSRATFKAVVEHMSSLLRGMGVPVAVQKFSYGNDKRDFRHKWEMDAATPKASGDENCNPLNNNSCNLCALIPGKSSNFIVAGAHLDTVKNSPGANDNGSSVVALLEAIRILQQSKLELNNPVLFCFWGSEELSTNGQKGIGFGSRYFLHNKGYEKVIQSLTNKDSSQGLAGKPGLQCYLNLELAGTKDRLFPEPINIGDPREYHRPSPPGTLNLTNLYAEFLESQNMIYYNAEPGPSRTDVGSFYAQNIPALTITAGPNPHTGCYHRPCDNITEVDFDVLSNITQTVLYALTKLSLGQGV